MMMLDEYDLLAFQFRHGSRYVQVPASHPAIAELTSADVSPVGAVRDREWSFLYALRDWNRIAAQQRGQPRPALVVEPREPSRTEVPRITAADVS